jgi:hypothetical protein
VGNKTGRTLTLRRLHLIHPSLDFWPPFELAPVMTPLIKPRFPHKKPPDRVITAWNNIPDAAASSESPAVPRA